MRLLAKLLMLAGALFLIAGLASAAGHDFLVSDKQAHPPSWLGAFGNLIWGLILLVIGFGFHQVSTSKGDQRHK